MEHELLMLATLEALNAIGGTVHKMELDRALAEREKITNVEINTRSAIVKGRHLKFPEHCALVRTYLNAGNAVNHIGKGCWEITETGKKIVKMSEKKARIALDDMRTDYYEKIRQRNMGGLSPVMKNILSELKK